MKYRYYLLFKAAYFIYFEIKAQINTASAGVFACTLGSNEEIFYYIGQVIYSLAIGIYATFIKVNYKPFDYDLITGDENFEIEFALYPNSIFKQVNLTIA